MIKLRWKDYLRLPRWALNAITSVLMRERHQKTRYTQKKRQCDHGGRDQRDVATSQRMLATTRSWKMRGWNPHRYSGGRVALPTP